MVEAKLSKVTADRVDALDDDLAEGRDVLPLEYYVDFLRYLRSDSRIKVITYADFCWGDDFDYRTGYSSERQRWEKRLEAGDWDASKIYVVLQHDVDSFPERAMQMLAAEAELGIPSTSMLFAERINRSVLTNEGRVESTPYDLDFDELRRLQSLGFLFGYHCNAYERAGFERDKAKQLFADDVAKLRAELRIDFFSPHGGVRDSEKQSNSIIEPDSKLSTSLRWIHNRFGPRFDGGFSDGGIVFGNRHGEDYDLAKFTHSWQPGRRYRVLIHPQYFHTTVNRAKTLVGMPWYEHALHRFTAQQGASATTQYWAWTPSTFQRFERKLWRRLLRTNADQTLQQAPSPIVITGDRLGVHAVTRLLQSQPAIATSPQLTLREFQVNRQADDQSAVPKHVGVTTWIKFRLTNAWPLRLRLQSRGWKRFLEANNDLGKSRIVELAEQHLRSGFTFDDRSGCLRFAARCSVERMLQTHKKRWTLCGDIDLEVVQQLWPDAKVVHVSESSDSLAFHYPLAVGLQARQASQKALLEFLG